MFEEQNKRLSEIKEKMRELEKLKADLKSADEKLDETNDMIEEYEVLTRKEEKDLDRVEGKSITALFYSILGSREEQIDKERQEYLAAKLKYEQYRSTAAALQQDIKDIKERINDIGNIESQYKELLSIKEKMIASANDDNARKLIEIDEELNNIKLDRKEINEAINAGNDSKMYLQRVIESLQSAEGWGVWDIAGGDFIATSVKHSRIDEARENADMAQQSLLRFQRELSDVGHEMKNINVEISPFEKFADYFFDNIITDWVVQSKIETSLDGAFNMESKVSNVIQNLEKRLNLSDYRQKQLEDMKLQLIEKSE